MAGVGADFSFHLYCLSRHVKRILRFKLKVEGRKDEVVYAEALAFPALSVHQDGKGEVSVLLSDGKLEFPGHGAELIAGEFFPLNLLPLRIVKYGRYRRVRKDVHPVHEIPLENDGLEPQDVTGVVCPPVPENTAAGENGATV